MNCSENGPDLAGEPLVPTAADPGSDTETGMHPAVREKLDWFTHSHLPPELAAVSEQFRALAVYLAYTLEGPQLTIGLQHLLEAKDCAVRARKAMG